jgi:integrase
MAKRLGIVKAFTKWCHANDYLDTDPFSGLQINAHKVNASKLRKEAWTVKEIGTMLEAVWPLRNCPDPREQEWCWYLLSLIGSGCRASEILNRDVADVKQDGESWLWDINTAEDKPVKNVFSIRKIPIPKALLAVGYMEYAKAQKPSGKLFPRLCQAGSMMISFKFARLTKSLNLYTKTKTLHSIRAYHAVSMELAGVHPSLARSIAGHQVAADVHGVYLNSLKFPMERMQQAVDTVPIPLPKEEI